MELLEGIEPANLILTKDALLRSANAAKPHVARGSAKSVFCEL